MKTFLLFLLIVLVLAGATYLQLWINNFLTEGMTEEEKEKFYQDYFESQNNKQDF
jgi:NADH:ubiquinone oxidoreductase subunit 3 (subunit A)